ncbi:hypothetical protein M569_01650 [Genlisea aurea]|uniref:CW-type domain-containing protein n=1 Tax=Genlisea aurea TaxID=192259 RepID=S8D017_9LAMI|nr:hypothetical protein M569_01650 [Genlisea aurea]
MGDTEIEEGEALNFHEEDGADSTIDPDVALSYIEEKIQNVLGHFQKEFEGVVTAESLGAKFGTYGSFLPMYPRSPSWSRAQNPKEVVPCDSKISPRSIQLQDKKQKSLAPVSISPSARSGASRKAVSAVQNSEGQGKLQSSRAENLNSKSGTAEKSVNNLKLRIKVGSGNLSTQKNADIYSGLGLVSPSSSFDGSPTTQDESPISILQIMTSFHGDALLSPLSDDLIHLSQKLSEKNETKAMPKTCGKTENLGVLKNGVHSSKIKEKISEVKRKKSSEKFTSSTVELPDQPIGNKDMAIFQSRKEKETDLDALGCEELVSNALKLPLLSSSEYETSLANNSKDGFRVETLPSFTNKEHVSSVTTQDIAKVRQSDGRLGSLSSISDSEKEKHLGSFAAGPVNNMEKAEVSYALEQSEGYGSKGRKGIAAAGNSDPSKQSIFHKGVRAEDFKSSLELSSSGDKKKIKANQPVGSQGTHTAKDESTVESSMSREHEKIVPAARNDSQVPPKDSEKPANRYKDFFGDEEFEDDDDNDSLSGEMTSAERSKYNHLPVPKSFTNDRSMPKEKCSNKSSENPLPQDVYPDNAFPLAAPPVNGPSSEAPTGMQPMEDDHWVSCDICDIWRLLPPGKDPNSLLDKPWNCSMLDWLPDMNRCYIPEELTSNAVIALYQPSLQLPVPASGSRQHVGTAAVPAGFSGQEYQNIAKLAANNGKKKDGPKKEISADLDGATRRKKTSTGTGKVGNLNRGGNNSPYRDACEYQVPGQSSSAAERLEHSKRKMALISCSGRGIFFFNVLTCKGKQEADVDGSGASKRVRTGDLHVDDEKWVATSKGANATARLSNNTSRNDGRKHRNHNDLPAVGRKDAVSDVNTEIYVPSAANNHSGKYDEKDSVKKRKAKEHRLSEIHSATISNSGKRRQDSGEAAYEGDHRKEKRARVSKSGKDANVVKTGLQADWKSRGQKDECNGLYIENNQVSDNLKNDLGSLHPSVAANSSSSKVSGSHKNRTAGQEVKGSPVESVSSSPLRYQDVDKIASSAKNLAGKYKNEDSGSLAAVSSRRLSCNGGGSVQPEPMKKDIPMAKKISEQGKGESKLNNGQSQETGFHSKKFEKGSSHSKDLAHASGFEVDKVSNRASDSSHDSLDCHRSSEEKTKSRKNKSSDDKCGMSIKGEKSTSRKDIAGTHNENGKAERIFSYDGQDGGKSPRKKHNVTEEHCKGKSHSLPPLARVSVETDTSPNPSSGFQKQKGVKTSSASAIDNDNMKTPMQKSKAENSNGPTAARLPTPNSHKVRDADASSPVRRDSSSHAANKALKEAKDLKHMADRVKNSGSSESISIYFQAALKFLYAASLFESGGSEGSKNSDSVRALQLYSSTAKLCEYCAHEYEKLKDLAAAALAYKCVEVAYMRVVYSSHPSASRDRSELQSALQIIPPGESPSSSASDVDNLNHQAAPDKAALARVGGSPHVSGTHVISSRNRSGFLRILNFAQDVNFAMDASRKSRTAFTAAMSRLSETSNEDVISSVKKTLDYSFQDVEGFLHVVRVAMEAISR